MRWMKADAFALSKIDWQSEPKAADLPDLNGWHLYGYLVIFNTPKHSRVKTRGVLIGDVP